MERLLVELKFWAGLTDNQPVAYLKKLPTDCHSALLEVAPARRIESLWWLEHKLGEKAPESLLSSDVVPIFLRPGYTYYEVVDDLVKQLRYLATLFQEVYSAESTAASPEGVDW